MNWKKLRAKIDGKPTGRHGPTLEYYGHKLYMFGEYIESCYVIQPMVHQPRFIC